MLPGEMGERFKAMAWLRGLNEPLRGFGLHDLRHTFASHSVMGGATLHVAGALLGHSQAQTTMRYAHLANDPVRQANEAIGARIAAALGPRVRAAS